MEENKLVFLPAWCEMHYQCFLNEAGGKFLRDFTGVWRSARSAIFSLSAAMILMPGNAVIRSSGCQVRATWRIGGGDGLCSVFAEAGWGDLGW